MDAEVWLRDATLDDVAAIARFQAAQWLEDYRGLVPDSYLESVGIPDRALRWHERLTTRARWVAVAHESTSLVGLVSWSEDPDDTPPLRVHELYVDRAHRGSGLAQRLAEWAVGGDPAQLEVFEGNARGRRLYEALGFAADGSRRADPDTGVWLIHMVRQI